MAGQKVLIVQQYIPKYRLAFFEKLRESLRDQDITLDVAYGRASVSAQKRKDETVLESAIRYRDLSLRIGTKEIVYQRLAKRALGYDLVILEHANRFPLNYLLMLTRRFSARPKRLAFWGHGKNFQGSPASFREKWKSWTSLRTDWWFAYTQLSASVIQQRGFERNRITIVRNTIDTERFSELMTNLSSEMVQEFVEMHDLSANTCLFIGGIYSEKRLPFLLDACEEIIQRIPNFRLLIAGDGEDSEWLSEVMDLYPFAKWIGRVDDEEKALAFASSKLLLMPGLVGLAIVDSFVARVPLVTTNYEKHSPEIDYLVPNKNGIWVETNNCSEYAAAVVDLLVNPQKILRIREGCISSASETSMHSMVSNFVTGILNCLELQNSVRQKF